MKYPQLVSTRAVNAISDWLVSRLEQIGVEAPLIYSRLLLSLLHSSVQINDPIEFNNLERYFANQKGNKRFPPCDTETIKKFTAIQCLLDAVSTEQEISCIENLVDELFEKLLDLEKQSNEEDSEHIHHQLQTTIKSLDVEDPRKRYYRAFPALCKEMEDSVLLTKHNNKSLTWPTGSSGASSTNMVALSNTAGVKRKNKRRRNQGINKGRISSDRKNSFGGNSSPTWDTDFEGNWEMGTDLIKEFLMSQKNRNRSISESDASNFHYEKNTEKRMKPTTKQEVDNISKSSHIREMSLNKNYDNKEMMARATKNLNLNTFAQKSECEGNMTTLGDIKRMNLKNADDDMNEYVPYDELILFKDFDHLSNCPQLYQDDTCFNKKSSTVGALQQQQNDFAQFEAKFNSDVEALWKDDRNKKNSQISPEARQLNQINIDNFWTNYYNHHYNSMIDKDLRSVIAKTAAGFNGDFYSLPANFGKFECSAEKNIEKPMDENDVSSVGVFISDSIWSDNISAVNKDFCEENNSFCNNFWAPKINSQGDTCDRDLPNPFNISKWSECSFETPFIPSSVVPSATSRNVSASGTKHLFGGSYKLPIVANINKQGSLNTVSQQNHLSQSMSLPDYHGSSLRCFGIEKSQKMLPSNAPDGMPQHQERLSASTSSTISTTRSVSLTNHSKTSGFVEYSIVKSSASYFQFNPTIKFDRNANGKQERGTMPLAPSSHQMSFADESKVTSASMHNNSSASSSSPLDDDDNLLTSYRTHFRPIKQSYVDGYEFDISGNLDEIEFDRSKSGSLYFESEKYCEYIRVESFVSDEEASASKRSINEGKDVIGPKRVRGLYPLKFRVTQLDKQCQTEDPTKKAKVAKRAGRVKLTKKRNNNTNNRGKGRLLKISRGQADCCDYFFKEEASIDIDQWTMAEIGKNCADNNNSHTLWGMCPACTKQNKCVPADSLLKDELILEADEIMSDLKYMQDLYICSDWENEDYDNDDTDSELEALRSDYDDDSDEFESDDSDVDEDDNDDNEEQEQIFYNITKLISDLLKPENAKTLVNALSAGTANQNINIFKGKCSEDDLVDNANNAGSIRDYQKNIFWKNLNNNNTEKYIGGLWINDENIIWNREIKPTVNSDVHLNEDKSTFLEKHDWKHTNLAAIWNNGAGPALEEMEVKATTSSYESLATQTTDNTTPASIAFCSNDIQSDLAQSRLFLPSSTEHEHINLEEMTPTTMNSRNMKNPISWNISSSKHSVGSSSTRLAPQLYDRCSVEHSMNCCAISQSAANRPDRKRRHSASQNIGCIGICNGENGTLDWLDANNRTMLAKIGSCSKVGIMTKWESDYNKLSSMMNTTDDSLSSSSLSPKTTIITCKYWTTMDTTLASPYFTDKSSHYDGIGAMALNPTSILRHVTVVSRPLTR